MNIYMLQKIILLDHILNPYSDIGFGAQVEIYNTPNLKIDSLKDLVSRRLPGGSIVKNKNPLAQDAYLG